MLYIDQLTKTMKGTFTVKDLRETGLIKASIENKEDE